MVREFGTLVSGGAIGGRGYVDMVGIAGCLPHPALGHRVGHRGQQHQPPDLGTDSRLLVGVILDRRARHVAERDGAGHLDGDPSGKGTDLFMDVHEVGLRFPASHLLDGEVADAVEVHGHGTPGAEGVAADIVLGVAKVVETNISSGGLEDGVDSGRGDEAWEEELGVAHSVDGGCDGLAALQDVVDAAGQGFDRAVVSASALLGDALAFDAILLVGHANGGLVSREQGG